jgi:hypothetical protein
MKSFRTAFQFLLLAISAILILACGGISSISELLPGNKPTATLVVVPTNAPVAVAPTSAPTVALPTFAPAVVAATSTPTASSGSSTTMSELPAAIAKTRGATVYKSHEEMIMDKPFGANRDGLKLMLSDGEFNGKDAHIKLGGTLLALFNIDPNGTLEVVVAGGKAYAHGPASGIGAPENKWYVLPPEMSGGITSSQFDTYDKIFKSKLDYANFTLDRSTLNGVSCKIYKADKNVAYAVWSDALFSATGVAPVVDAGSIELTACSDGYLHALEVTLSGHDPKNPDQKGTAHYLVSFKEFDTKVAIAAPPDAVPAVAPSGGIFDLIGTPTPGVASNTPTPSRPINVNASMDGDWKGTTATNNSISFTIKNGQVNFASFNLLVRNGSCSGSISYGATVNNTFVNNNTFTAQMKDSDGVQYTVIGNFNAGQFTGTIRGSGKLLCDAAEATTTWSAQNISAVATPTKPAATIPPSVPTKSAAPTVPGTASDPRSVIDGFFNGINANNPDAALAFVGDNVIFDFGSVSGMTKSNLRAHIATVNARGITFTLSNYSAIGNTIIDFAAQASDGTSYKKSSAIISNGKINILNVK